MLTVAEIIRPAGVEHFVLAHWVVNTRIHLAKEIIAGLRFYEKCTPHGLVFVVLTQLEW